MDADVVMSVVAVAVVSSFMFVSICCVALSWLFSWCSFIVSGFVRSSREHRNEVRSAPSMREIDWIKELVIV